MSDRFLLRRAVSTTLAALAFLATTSYIAPRPALAQDELFRKVKSRVSPQYPEMARKMSISGSVRVVVVVAPNGSIKSTKLLGGHPLLVNAAMDALKQWKFEPASEESSGTVEFKFKPE